MKIVVALFAIMLGGTGAAQAAWLEASTKHFVIYSDTTPAQLREFATRLEKFDGALRWLQDLPERDGGESIG